MVQGPEAGRATPFKLLVKPGRFRDDRFTPLLMHAEPDCRA